MKQVQKESSFSILHTSNNWNWIEIGLPIDVVITQLQFSVGYSGDVKKPEVVFNQAIQTGFICE